MPVELQPQDYNKQLDLINNPPDFEGRATIAITRILGRIVDPFGNSELSQKLSVEEGRLLQNYANLMADELKWKQVSPDKQAEIEAKANVLLQRKLVRG